ncbi:tRNA (cytosine(72)-C(5))-methyltransferase NSUN6 [Phoenix dactylifera]|uniref:tRNA (Cytosine(72)-C(5))-methyltransferase NSUN6 n=1 Tax=Phoenix dactylifera TaxID=42345 RepID=A0A8B9A6X1_PHODC|nr:tRNA (cytosine(72)-C(5))-methyltransferase NSUN6 [Phoenix dactylifera]
MKRAGDFLLRNPRRRSSTTTASTLRVAMDSSCSSSSTERYSYNPALRWNPQVEEYFIKAYGAEHFARISKALAHPSCYSCIRVNTLRSSSDAVIKKLATILDDKKLAGDIDGMTISKQSAAAEVDQVMKPDSFCETLNPDHRLATGTDGDTSVERVRSPCICKCPYPGLDNVVFVKGSGPHTFQYDGQTGQPVKEVIVSRKCAEAVLRGAQVYVPGVLACSSHVEKGDMVAVSVAVEQPLNDNGWGVGITRGTVLQGLLSDPQYHGRNGMYIGQGKTLMSRAGIFRVPEGIAVEMTNRVYKLPSFHDVLEGEIFLQNLPSIITAHVLDPQQGERILDMCAAPGGKTTAIAILLKDRGEVVAIDRSHNKVMEIMKLAAEMDLTCINAYKLDALKSVRRTNEGENTDVTDHIIRELDMTVKDSKSFRVTNGDVVSSNTETSGIDVTSMQTGKRINNGKADLRRYVSKADLRKNARRMRNGPGRNHCMGARVENSKGFLPNSFDRVLLDAPCSALGLRPRLFAGQETVESLRNHAKYQRRMFDQAVQLVRPGGVIVYSTCTINPGENEALVRYALDTYKFLSLASQVNLLKQLTPKIGGPGITGRCELFGGEYVEEWLTQSEAELVQRFDPSSSLDTIGFFISKFHVGQKDL